MMGGLSWTAIASQLVTWPQAEMKARCDAMGFQVLGERIGWFP